MMYAPDTIILRSARIALPLLAALLLFLPVALSAQMENNHVKWQLLTTKVEGMPGETVEVKVKAALVPGAHMYTTKGYPAEALGPNPTEVTVGERGVVTMAGGLKANKKAIKKIDPNFDSLETQYWEGTVTFTVPVKIPAKAKSGEKQGWVNFYFMTCDDKSCKPPTDKKFTFAVNVLEDTTGQASADSASESDTGVAGLDTTSLPTDSGTGVASTPPPGNTETIEPTNSTQADIENAKKEGLLSYILLAMTFGFGALLTPCVFPMIPITVSFFTKREHNNRAHAVRDSAVYAGGIILTFTALGTIVAALFGATGVSDIATNPFINILIAGIFIAFALSLFGLFEIQVPSGILNKLNAKANQGGGMTSLLLMGLVFSLTSFTCTVPFVGPALFSIDQGGDWFWPIIGMAAFAFAFSLPFFLLALFPSWLKSMPKSGGWLNAVKVTMGFVEIAAAMKFLSNVDLIWDWGILTREAVLAVWIAIAILASLYLLGRYQLPHDTPVERVGVMRMMISMAFLAMGFWFLTGLFGGRLGEVDAFLPPQEYPGKGNTSILASLEGMESSADAGTDAGSDTNGVKWVRADGMSWIQDDYATALAEAKRSGKPLFIDFTGYTCTNCRWMERNVFTKEDVRNLMEQYVLVRLYTDRREESNLRNRQMQVDRFKTIDLPFYAVISPEDQVIASREFTRDVDQFKGFLQRGIDRVQVVRKGTGTSEGEEIAEK